MKKLVLFLVSFSFVFLSFAQKTDEKEMLKEFEKCFIEFKKLKKAGVLKRKSNEDIYWIGGNIDKRSAFIKISNKKKKDYLALYYVERRKSIFFEHKIFFSLGTKKNKRSEESLELITSLKELKIKILPFKENLAKLQGK
jgi:hypothetical protein